MSKLKRTGDNPLSYEMEYLKMQRSVMLKNSEVNFYE